MIKRKITLFHNKKAIEGETENEKAKNRQKQREDTLDLFALPDFLEDDEEDDDFEPPVQRKTRRKAVPLPADDDDEEEEDDEDDDDDVDKDKDYDEEDNGDDDDDEEDEEDDDDEEITIQVGKADERKRKKQTVEVQVKERTTGQRSVNMDQATEFRKYICDLMAQFEEHVKKGKQVKKYLLEMIQDVREACMNMRYPGMDFDPEDIIPTISDPSFKAWRAMLSGVEFADRDDMKGSEHHKEVEHGGWIGQIRMRHK